MVKKESGRIFEMKSPKHIFTPCKHQPDSLSDVVSSVFWDLKIVPTRPSPVYSVADGATKFKTDLGDHPVPASLWRLVSCGCPKSVKTFPRIKSSLHPKIAYSMDKQ